MRFFTISIVSVPYTDFSLSGKFAAHAQAGVIEEKEKRLMTVRLHPCMIKNLPMLRRKEESPHGELYIQSVQTRPEICAPMRIKNLLNKRRRIISQ